MKSISSLFRLSMMFGLTIGAFAQAAVAQQASDPMPVPRFNAPLQGNVEQREIPGGIDGTTLNGGASDWNGANQQGTMGQPWSQQLQGGASDTQLSGNAESDPDAGNQELEIAWDQWRNNLIQNIQAGTLAKINVHDNVHFVWDPQSQMMQSRYPNGTSTWYQVDVLPNRKIVNIRLTQTSRFPSYDQAVIQAIKDLQGSKSLQYPRGSKRSIVTQEANVSTSAQTNFSNYQFGDVERQRQ